MDKLIEQGVQVDAVICDPPYGTTACKWDSIIPLEEMWERLDKICKVNGAKVLFGSQPFTSKLIMSNIKNYKYQWVWEKNKATGYLNSKKRPLVSHEDITVFYNKQCLYNPQMTPANRLYSRGLAKAIKSECYGEEKDYIAKETGLRYPRSIFKENVDMKAAFHPTQKPVPLMEYLIKTYTNEGDIILDPTMGSGTTGLACKNLNRNFIGIEKDETYFNIAKERINQYH